MSSKVNFHIGTTIDPMLLNSAYGYGPTATVEIELKQRCHTQRRNRQGRVTRVEFPQVSNFGFNFDLPLSLLSQPPQLCNLYILELLLSNSNILERELFIDLAPQIAHFADYYSRGSLRWFFIKAEVEVARFQVIDEEEEEDEMELLTRERERERLEEEEEMELLLRESLDLVQKVDMGASISVIEKLKKERKVDSDRRVGKCMVCLEELSRMVELIAMPCDHLFHQSCICRWLEEKNSCPICRCEMA